jgi:HPt (histidine-containing phosphotransfer) domain-containing protein
MFETDRQALDRGTAAGTEGVIDLGHLTRMTFGEESLRAEVLALFDRQAGMLLARIEQAAPREAAAFAHTLVGSARGVGAWEVAAAAAGLERAVSEKSALPGALARLAAAVGEARTAARELLADCGAV